jgi:hypothetical protein
MADVILFLDEGRTNASGTFQDEMRNGSRAVRKAFR